MKEIRIQNKWHWLWGMNLMMYLPNNGTKTQKKNQGVSVVTNLQGQTFKKIFFYFLNLLVCFAVDGKNIV